MPPRKKSVEPTIYDQLQPLINILTVGVGIVIFCYNTFAQLSYVKEQHAQIQVLVDQRFKDAIDHSDQNRERMLVAIDGLKQMIQGLDSKIRR